MSFFAITANLYGMEVSIYKKMMHQQKTQLEEEKLKSTRLMLEIYSLKSKYETILKNKEKEILYLKNKINLENKTISVEKEICKDGNAFPQLMMKNSSEKNK